MTDFFDSDCLDSDYLQPARPLRLRSGEDYMAEKIAAEWLAKSRVGVTALSDKRDYFTQDQLTLRAQREVLTSVGVPDEHLYSGLFKRAFNPLSGHRPTSHMRAGEE